MTNSELDEVRVSLINNWTHHCFYVWHREFKDSIETPYVGKKVIVISTREAWKFQGTPRFAYAPFIHNGVPIILYDSN